MGVGALCIGVRCFQGRRVCLVGSTGIFFICGVIVFSGVFFHVVVDGLPCVEFCFGIVIVYSWWRGK